MNFTNQIYILHAWALAAMGKENGSKAFIIRSQMLNNRNKFRNTMINYKSLLHRAICNDHLSNENQKFRTCYFI